MGMVRMVMSTRSLRWSLGSQSSRLLAGSLPGADPRVPIEHNVPSARFSTLCALASWHDETRQVACSCVTLVSFAGERGDEWKEVPAVKSGLFDNGFEVSGLHNHLNQMSPHVMYMH